MVYRPGLAARDVHTTEAVPETSASAARRRLSATAITVGVIALVGLVLRLALLARPLAFVDRRYIPDDTYYTLTIARSMAHGHGPTLDGSTLTSGFQPLIGFVMTPVFWFTENPDTALRINLLFLVIVDVLTIVVLAWVAYRLAGKVAAITAAALWAVSPAAVAMALGGLETSLAIFLEITLVAALVFLNDRPSTWRWIGVGAFAALAALARIDALILVGLLLLVQLWRGPRRELWIAAVASFVVAGPWWIWCWINLGTPLPTSGAAAHRLLPYPSFSKITQSLAAGAVSGGPVGPWDWFRARVIEHPAFGVAAFWFFVVALVALAAWCVRRGRDAPVWLFAATLPAFSACLLVFYAWYGVTFYFTRYLSPIALVTALVIAVFAARIAEAPARLRPIAWGLAGAAAVIVGIAIARTQVGDLTDTHANAARIGTAGFYDATTGYRETIHEVLPYLPAHSTVGGWQSGALSYFAPKNVTVVNLDGVVNPDAVTADQHKRLGDYMRARNIGTIADFPFAAANLEQQAAAVHPAPAMRVIADIPADHASPPYRVIAIDWP
jgi:hypothetical protein